MCVWEALLIGPLAKLQEGRHDEPKELFAGMASVLWRDVGVEPLLEELSGEVMS